MLRPMVSLTQTDQLSEQIRSMTRRSRRLIESAEAILRRNIATYDTKFMECGLCARRHPLGTKKCHPCNNTDLRQLYCTCELRVSDYMEVLRQVELWGSATPLELLAASEIRSRMFCTCADVKHSCDAGLNCPLRIQIGVVSDKLQRLLDDCSGLSLGDSKQEGCFAVHKIT
jgi:hypothetical protein